MAQQNPYTNLFAMNMPPQVDENGIPLSIARPPDMPQEMKPVTPQGGPTQMMPSTPREPSSLSLPMPSSPAPDYESQIQDLYRKGLSDRTDGIRGYQEELGKLGERPSGLQAMDFSPLAGLVDTWTGSNLAQTYKAPTAGKDFDAKKALLQKAITDSQGALTDDQLAFLKMKADERKADEAAQLRQMMFSQRPDRYNEGLEGDVQKLEKRMGEGVSGIKTNLDKLNSIIGTKGDIPGVGPGVNFIPDMLLAEDGSQVRQLARGLVGDLIKLQSGTAASDSEVARKLEELGMGRTSKDESFRRGLRNLRDKVSAELTSRQAGFRPEVVSRYKDRGGVLAEDVKYPQSGGGSPNTVRIIHEGKMMEIPASDLQDALKDGARRAP